MCDMIVPRPPTEQFGQRFKAEEQRINAEEQRINAKQKLAQNKMIEDAKQQLANLITQGESAYCRTQKSFAQLVEQYEFVKKGGSIHQMETQPNAVLPDSQALDGVQAPAVVKEMIADTRATITAIDQRLERDPNYFTHGLRDDKCSVYDQVTTCRQAAQKIKDSKATLVEAAVQQHYPVDVLKNSAKLSINERRSTTYCGCTEAAKTEDLWIDYPNFHICEGGMGSYYYGSHDPNDTTMPLGLWKSLDPKWEKLLNEIGRDPRLNKQERDKLIRELYEIARDQMHCTLPMPKN
jgi:hypothetical protein